MKILFLINFQVQVYHIYIFVSLHLQNKNIEIFAKIIDNHRLLTSSLKVQQSAISFLKMNLRSAPVILYLYSAKPRSGDFLRMKKMHAALLLGISMNQSAVNQSKAQVGGCEHLGL